MKLADIPLLKNLSELDLSSLYQVLVPVFIDEGIELFKQGDEGNHLYLIQKGKVNITVTMEDGEHVFAQFGEGDFFGEMSVFSGQPRSATAITADNCLLLRADRKDFLELMGRRPNLGLVLSAALCDRIRKANSFSQQALQDRNQELANFNLRLEKLVQERTRDLELANEQLWHMAHRDELTQAYNRRHFFNIFEHQLDVSRRYDRPLSLLIVDIDHFKKINDTLGHTAGDEILVSLCRCMERAVRGVDMVARIGGEEFAILLPETPEEAAIGAAKRLVSTVRKTEFTGLNVGKKNITISVGVASLDGKFTNEDAEDLVRRADVALYRAKNSGRDRAATLAGDTILPA